MWWIAVSRYETSTYRRCRASDFKVSHETLGKKHLNILNEEIDAIKLISCWIPYLLDKEQVCGCRDSVE